MWMKWSKNRQLEVVCEWEYEWFSRVHAHILRTASHLVPHINEKVLGDIENKCFSWCFRPWHLVCVSVVLDIWNVGMSFCSKCLQIGLQHAVSPLDAAKSYTLAFSLSCQWTPLQLIVLIKVFFVIQMQQNKSLRAMLLTTEALPFPAIIHLPVIFMLWLMSACFSQGKWLKTMEIKDRVTTVQLSPNQSVSMGRSQGLWITRPKPSADPPPHPTPRVKESPQPARSASSPPASSSDPLIPSRKSPPGKYADH